jgi:hypothetical protein
MPTYLVTYHGGPGLPSDPEAIQQMEAAFKAWVTAVGSAIHDPGAPLGAAKTVRGETVSEGQNEVAIGGYTLLNADSLDEAVGFVRSHPFLTRGGSLQVNETVSPGG